jgi:hypothetical protein
VGVRSRYPEQDREALPRRLSNGTAVVFEFVTRGNGREIFGNPAVGVPQRGCAGDRYLQVGFGGMRNLFGGDDRLLATAPDIEGAFAGRTAPETAG